MKIASDKTSSLKEVKWPNFIRISCLIFFHNIFRKSSVHILEALLLPSNYTIREGRKETHNYVLTRMT